MTTFTQHEIACLVAKAEREYLSRHPDAKIGRTVIRDGLVVILGPDGRLVLSRYRATVTRCRVLVERV